MELTKEAVMKQAESACKSFCENNNGALGYKFEKATKSSVFLMKGPYKIKLYFSIKDSSVYCTVTWEGLYVAKKVMSNAAFQGISSGHIMYICLEVLENFMKHTNKIIEKESIDEKIINNIREAEKKEPLTETEKKWGKPDTSFEGKWGETVLTINSFLKNHAYTVPEQEISEKQIFSLGKYNFHYTIQEYAENPFMILVEFFHNGEKVIRLPNRVKNQYYGDNIFHDLLVHAIREDEKNE